MRCTSRKNYQDMSPKNINCINIALDDRKEAIFFHGRQSNDL